MRNKNNDVYCIDALSVICPWDAQACTFTFGCSIPGCTSQCLANMFQRVEDDLQPESSYQLTTVPDGPLLPVYEAPARFPVARSAFAVDAYRCPLLAATIYNIAAANSMSLSSSRGLDAPGLVRLLERALHVPSSAHADGQRVADEPTACCLAQYVSRTVFMIRMARWGVVISCEWGG